jgi:DNA polymerase-3 subunit delta'
MFRKGAQVLVADWPIYGHTNAVAMLQHSLQAGDGVPYHANLLLGPRQVGKSTLAHTYAQAILCTDANQRPCGVCRACRLMSRQSHPDFRLIQPLDKSGAVDRLDGTLRAEQAAELIHDAALRPVESRYKVFLLQDFHHAHDAFANKLLKTLEEPPDHVILCLTATDRSQLLPTIVSRCRLIELRPQPHPVIAQALQGHWQATEEQAQLLARLANGCLGWAVEQLSQPNGQQERLVRLQMLWHMLESDRIDRLMLAEQLASNRNNQQLFGLLETWLTWWRDLLLAQTGCADECANLDQQELLIQQARHLPLSEIQQYLAVLRRVERYLHHTVNTRLALDVLVLRLPRVKATSS